MCLDFSDPESALYLAYGSNLHPLRLQARLPTSHLIAVTTIAGFQIKFNKRGQDGSGKCNLTPSDAQVSSYGALYRIDRSDIPELNRIESGYSRHHLDIELSDGKTDGRIQSHQAFTYLANPESIDHSLQPYAWYHELVIAGAQFLNFDPGYLQQLRQVTLRHDPQPERSARQRQLLLKLHSDCNKIGKAENLVSRISRWERSDTGASH